MSNLMNFDGLVSVIEQTHLHFQQQAVKAVNVSLTVRNWLVGCYIVEFEQHGEEKALYGEKLISRLAERVSAKGMGETNLKNCRLFYKTYPGIAGLLQNYFPDFLPAKIRQLATDQFQLLDSEAPKKSQLPTDELHPSDKSAKLKKARSWWNTPPPAWTNNSSYPNTFWNCPGRNNWKPLF
jgi:hypothetical protein